MCRLDNCYSTEVKATGVYSKEEPASGGTRNYGLSRLVMQSLRLVLRYAMYAGAFTKRNFATLVSSYLANLARTYFSLIVRKVSVVCQICGLKKHRIIQRCYHSFFSIHKGVPLNRAFSYLSVINTLHKRPNNVSPLYCKKTLKAIMQHTHLLVT